MLRAPQFHRIDLKITFYQLPEVQVTGGGNLSGHSLNATTSGAASGVTSRSQVIRSRRSSSGIKPSGSGARLLGFDIGLVDLLARVSRYQGIKKSIKKTTTMR